jgi:NAD(P)-dependent dehydrogenase (short-subunit alcohol dehydrogenase family)
MAPKYSNKLENRLVIVVGGTSGIGYAVAEASLEGGAIVVIASRTQKNIDAAVANLTEAYPDAAKRIRGHPCNLVGTDAESDVVKLFDFATNNGATKIDHIVDTAAADGPTVGDLASATVDAFLDSYRARCLGSAVLAKYALKYMRPESSSSITMTSGILVRRPMKGMSPRIAASSAKEGLARTFAVDLAPIRVNVVSPGAIMTPLLVKMFERFGEGLRENMAGSNLLGKIGQPEDIAESYLCSMKNGFMTGQVVQCDGGFLVKN